MSINWKMYDSRDLFPVMYAVFLWHEIEPSQHQLLDPPGPILMKSHSIIKAILSVRGPFAGPLDMTRNKQLIELYQPTIKQKLPEGIPPYVANVRRWELVTAANRLGETPKFLFPEARQRDSQENSQIVVDKNLGTNERNSYCAIIRALAAATKGGRDIDEQLLALEESSQKRSHVKLVRELLKGLEIDPHERSTTKKLLGMVEEAGEKLGDDKIRKILKEVQALDENP
jgi:hypothetical protein